MHSRGREKVQRNNMHMRSILTQLAVVFGVPVMILGVYWFALRDGVSEEPPVRSDLVDKATKVREALAIVGRLKFDGKLFDMPAFSTLEDQSVPIVEEEVGRPNPFVPPLQFRPVTPLSQATSSSAQSSRKR